MYRYLLVAERKITFWREEKEWVINSDGSDLKEIPELDDYYKLGGWKIRWFPRDGSKVIFWDFKSGAGFYFKKINSSQVYFICKQASNLSPIFDLFWEE